MEPSDGAPLSPSSLTFLAASEHLAASTFEQPPASFGASPSHPSEVLHDNARPPAGASRNDQNSGHQGTPTGTPQAGPARKQNVACDACRAKKIRCQRNATTEICGQCSSKGSGCTSNYIEQLAQKAKVSKKSRAPNGEKDANGPKRKRSQVGTDIDEGSGGEEARRGSSASGGAGQRLTEDSLGLPQSSRRTTLVSQGDPSVTTNRYFNESDRPVFDLRPSEKQANLIRYLLSVRPITHGALGYDDVPSMEACEAGHADLWDEQDGKVWKEEPTEAHVALTDVGMRELADELVERFFTLVYLHFDLYEPSIIRAQLAAPDTHPDGPLAHNFLALVLAFGARFSDHPVINADREECMGRDEAAYGAGQRPPRSRLVQLLAIRAREVIERHKTHRIPTLSNIRVLMLGQLLFSRERSNRHQFYSYHGAAAVQHMYVLQYNTPNGLSDIKNERERKSAILTWWNMVLSDAFRATFTRTKPNIDDDGYHPLSDDYPLPPISSRPGSGDDRGQQANVWIRAVAAGARLCRRLCADLWNYKVPTEGIPLSALETFMESCASWRDNFLSRLGVPSEWPTTWSFSAAIMACSTDAYYHTLWLVVEHAVKDYGIRESRSIELGGNPELASKIEAIRGQIRIEAEHGARRISSLTSILALNNYLRIDPLVLTIPLMEAGLFLADQGREECMVTVAGLRQYCIAFPQVWHAVVGVETLFQARTQARSSSDDNQSGPALRRESKTFAKRTSDQVEIETTGEMQSEAQAAGAPAEAIEIPEMVVKGRSIKEKDVSVALFEWLHQA